MPAPEQECGCHVCENLYKMKILNTALKSELAGSECEVLWEG